MHQTFYIDIDEEITSVVERLRGARAGEIILVVPKRALLIQSIVNLRLLRKEADTLGLQLMIVTQDKLGKLLVEKAGILVQQKMEDVEGEEVIVSSEDDGYQSPIVEEEQEKNSLPKNNQNSRLDKIGSDSYFDSSLQQVEDKKTVEIDTDPSAESEKIVNRELVKGIAGDIKLKNPRGVDSMIASLSPSPDSDPVIENNNQSFSKPPMDQMSLSRPAQKNYDKDEEIERFFLPGGMNRKERKESNETEYNFSEKNVSHGMKKYVWIFGGVCLLAILGVSAYIFLPEATIAISVKGKTKTIDSEVKADVNSTAIDYDKDIIPAKVISVTAEVNKNFSVNGNSGTSSNSNQKAHGTITIYNEFSSSSQPLVATTRFQTEDGKIFRLVKSVTIPGTAQANGETKPGVIEADVIADEAGDKYNIGSTNFTIPGFKDSGDKYKKIYAKSTSAMTGGGNGDASSNGGSAKVLSQRDVEDAKSKILADINSAAKEKVKSSVDSGMTVLDDAINIDEATYKISNSVGDKVDSFEMKASVNASALVFSESDLKNFLAKQMANSQDGKIKMDGSTITLDYGKANADFKMGTLDIKVHGVGKVDSGIDVEALRKGILGKNSDDLVTYLKTYPDIEKVDVTYWPPLIANKIPMYESRVKIQIGQ